LKRRARRIGVVLSTINTDPEKIVGDLLSEDPTVYMEALRDASTLTLSLIAAMTRKLTTTSFPGPVAEHLASVAVSVREGLEQVLREASDPYQKALAAIVLLKLGVGSGVDCLIAAVEQQQPTALLAANALSQAGVARSAEAIEQLLESWDLKADPYGAASLVADLQRFGSLSVRVFNRLSGPESPEILRSGLRLKSS